MNAERTNEVTDRPFSGEAILSTGDGDSSRECCTFENALSNQAAKPRVLVASVRVRTVIAVCRVDGTRPTQRWHEKCNGGEGTDRLVRVRCSTTVGLVRKERPMEKNEGDDEQQHEPNVKPLAQKRRSNNNNNNSLAQSKPSATTTTSAYTLCFTSNN